MDTTAIIAVLPFIVLVMFVGIVWHVSEWGKSTRRVSFHNGSIRGANTTWRYSPRAETDTAFDAARRARIARAADTLSADAFIDAITITPRGGAASEPAPKRATCEYCGGTVSAADDECDGCGAPVGVACA